jgi:CHASE3 domain sensor protein
MLLGYMVLVLLTVVVVVYALVSLQRINSLNKSIVKIDIPTQEAADKMLDAVLAQDTYEKRFLILKSEDMKKLFSKRGDEFRTWLQALKDLPGTNTAPIEALENLHGNYTELFSQEIKLAKANKSEAHMSFPIPA